MPADRAGRRRLLTFGRDHGEQRLWVIEGTGSFGAELTTLLLASAAVPGERDRSRSPLLQPQGGRAGTPARDLVRRGQEIDRFLGECRADVAVDDGFGNTEIDVCALPVGHKGRHRPEPLAPSPVSEACNRAQDLADRASDVAWRLGWLSAEIDHRDPPDKAAIPDQREQLRDLLVDLDSIARNAKRLTTTLDTADQLLQADARHTDVGVGRPALPAPPDLAF